MNCPKCGKILPDNAANCKKCGTVFKENKGNAEMDAYLKKEKEKAAKLNEKKKSKKAEKKTINKKLIAVIAAIVAVVCIAIVLLFHFDIIGDKNDDSNSKNNAVGALAVEYTFKPVSDEDAVIRMGDVNISAAEYEFFYRQSYSTVQNNAQLSFKDFVSKKLGSAYDENGDYYDEYFADFMAENPNTFDFTTAIDEQETLAVDTESGQNITWAEYIRKDAVKTMAGYRVKYELAVDMGLELTDDVRLQVYDHIEGLRTAVTDGGYPSLDQYLKILFGQSCDEEFFKNELIREYMATKYDSAVNNKYMAEYTDEEVKSIYESDYKEYDFADLYVYEVTGSDAQTVARRIAGATTDLTTFSNALVKNMGEGAAYEAYPAVPKYYIDSNYTRDVGDWAFDRQRKSGDISVFKTQKGYSVVYVLSPAYTKEDCLTYREIVFNKKDTTNGREYTEDELIPIREKAEEIYKNWQKGSADENTFAYYAIGNSQGNTATTGGLNAGSVAAELSDEELRTWLTDSGRKTGDTQIVESDEAIRIVYFVKNYGDYWNYSIRSDLAGKEVTAKLNAAETQTYAAVYGDDALEELEDAYIESISEIYLGR